MTINVSIDALQPYLAKKRRYRLNPKEKRKDDAKFRNPICAWIDHPPLPDGVTNVESAFPVWWKEQNRRGWPRLSKHVDLLFPVFQGSPPEKSGRSALITAGVAPLAQEVWQ